MFEPATHAFCVVGLGHLGLAQFAWLVRAGHRVVGLDVDEDRLARLARGTLDMHEPGVLDVIADGLRCGQAALTTSSAEAAASADVHVLCLGTPQQAGGAAADLSQLESAVQALTPFLTRRALLVGRSTVPVGTARRLARAVRSAAPAGAEVELVWHPEFLREGQAMADLSSPARVVVGVDEHGPTYGRATLEEMYAGQISDRTPWLVTDWESAELVKAASNAFLATKVSFANALTQVCARTGADVDDVLRGVGMDPRIGPDFLRPGLGYGGGCLPKDVRALSDIARRTEAPGLADLLDTVDAVNESAVDHVVHQLVDGRPGAVEGQRVAVLGAAFKPGTADVRSSPALTLAGRLAAAGAHVVVHDPQASEAARRECPGLDYTDSVTKALTDADAVVVATAWPVYAELDPLACRPLVATPLVLDASRGLDREAWRAAGWDYRAPGRQLAPAR